MHESPRGSTISVRDRRSALPTATCGCAANSSLVGQITSVQNDTTVSAIKAYDAPNRLQSISTVSTVSGASAAMPASYGYGYNAAKQRTLVTLADRSYWVYSYDSLGQVTSGKKDWQSREMTDQYNTARKGDPSYGLTPQTPQTLAAPLSRSHRSSSRTSTCP